MTVTILYFASLASKAQKSQEPIELDTDSSLASIYHNLQVQYGFELQPEQLRVAVNDSFADWDTSLKDGDTVAFIPPVAGG